MSVSMASLRLLAPRASLSLHSKQLQHRLALLPPALNRHASTTPPPKPRVLEKPERFNPPSHPSRIRSKPRYYGPDLSEHERQRQKTRRYPHMMPPEGSFMHWFLTDRSIHIIITLGILLSLTFGIWYQDFIHNTPYADLLPPNNMLFAHPITFFTRWAEVYQMHVSYISAQTAERRRIKNADVQKRSEYRKAHGLETEDGTNGGAFGGWVAKGEAEQLGPVLREGGSEPAAALVAVDKLDEDAFVDFQGKAQPLRKKWFGIW